MKWTLFNEKLPDIGTAFVTPYDDGSGARMFKRIGEDEFCDSEGDDSYGISDIQDNHFQWIALPDAFKLWFER